jgi:hypothetical protein
MRGAGLRMTAIPLPKTVLAFLVTDEKRCSINGFQVTAQHDVSIRRVVIREQQPHPTAV